MKRIRCFFKSKWWLVMANLTGAQSRISHSMALLSTLWVVDGIFVIGRMQEAPEQDIFTLNKL